MRTNRELSRAVRRALATGTIVVCGAGCLAVNAQQTPATSSNNATSKVQVAQAGRHDSKKSKAKSPHSKKIQLAQANNNNSNPILVAQATPPAAANAPSQLQEVVITGSLIERTNIETPNPVQVITSKDLVQSGYTDISDVMRNITANGANTLSQSFSFAFATGGSGISLRGLTLGDTLVLIDGERTVPYPLLDDNERSFVDLSSIPFTAVQQVQVLKDGGSALYGSDAIAGVVNVILRKTYQGLQVTAESGTSSHFDGTTEHLGFIGGVGDLASDGYNWYISGDLRHQDQTLASNRSGLWDTLNFTPWGGFNRTPGANPAENAGGSGYANSLTGYLTNPTTGAIVDFLPGCNATALTLDRCTYGGPGAQIAPSSTNVDLLGKFTKALAGDWEFGLQASWFDSRTDQVGEMSGTSYPFGVTNIAFGPHTNPTAVTYPLTTVPADYPGNTTGAPADLVYAFPELGEGSTVVNTNTYRLLMSLTGTAAGWKIKGTVGAMYARMADTDYGSLEPGALQTALNDGYVLGSPLGTSLFAPPAEADDTSNMDLVDIHGTHKLFDMPGGPMSLALGAQWVKEGHDVAAPATVADGIAEGDATYALGNEYDRAAFAELEGDPIKQLELDAQVRYDNYQTFGSHISPNFGVKFTPWQWIALRGTYGKGFRAPSAAEGISSGEAFGEGTYDDTALCPTAVPTGKAAGPGDFASQCQFGLTGVLTANPHLKNVTSTNWTTGIILQPIQAGSVTVDYYNIKVDNDIVGANSLASFTSIPVRGPDVTLGYCPPTSTAGCTTEQLINRLTPEGTILYTAFPYENASSTWVSGYDVDLQYHWDAGRIGRFTGEATWTHELTYKLTLNGSTYELAGTHGPASVSGDTGNPKDRITARLSWNKGPLTITPSLNFVGHFSITDPSAAGFGTCAAALGYDGNFPGGSVPADEKQFCTVGYFLETDLYASYQLSGKLEVHASVTNLFNKQPPMDVMTYGSGSYFYPYDAAFAEDGAIGRYFLAGVTYNFD
ncbi:MAG: TonB-dependent receptor plug domain-containing protein [Steroidobacteraceae bacterium]